MDFPWVERTVAIPRTDLFLHLARHQSPLQTDYLGGGLGSHSAVLHDANLQHLLWSFGKSPFRIGSLSYFQFHRPCPVDVFRQRAEFKFDQLSFRLESHKKSILPALSLADFESSVWDSRFSVGLCHARLVDALLSYSADAACGLAAVFSPSGTQHFSGSFDVVFGNARPISRRTVCYPLCGAGLALCHSHRVPEQPAF